MRSSGNAILQYVLALPLVVYFSLTAKSWYKIFFVLIAVADLALIFKTRSHQASNMECGISGIAGVQRFRVQHSGLTFFTDLVSARLAFRKVTHR